MMHAFTESPMNSRLGFHYYPDTLHYRELDLHTWLPELNSLGAAWLTVVAPSERAIPEFFLGGLLEAGIEPLLQFYLPLEAMHSRSQLNLFFNAYARWGVRYVILFDRPNSRASWPPSSWAQTDLVERFLDAFLPLAQSALEAGLIPVFPALEPGGDYWDTAFLRSALHGIQRRGYHDLLGSLVLSAYAGTRGRPLNWGAGGPERWPGARPYVTPPGVQDQMSFRIFDWYLAIARAEAGSTLPILLLQAGSHLSRQAATEGSEISQVLHAQKNLAIVRGLATHDLTAHNLSFQENTAGAPEPGALDPIPAEVLACNFWLLTATEKSRWASDAWFQADGSTLPVVSALRQWAANSRNSSSKSPKGFRPAAQPGQNDPGLGAEETGQTPENHPIAHYLLLPLNEWGVADWHLDMMQSFVKKYHPTVGFTLAEASLASRVTVVGGAQAFPDEVLDPLRAAGCTVERMIGDGTLIAT